jgi:hypothetical protein
VPVDWFSNKRVCRPSYPRRETNRTSTRMNTRNEENGLRWDFHRAGDSSGKRTFTGVPFRSGYAEKTGGCERDEASPPGGLYCASDLNGGQMKDSIFFARTRAGKTAYWQAEAGTSKHQVKNPPHGIACGEVDENVVQEIVNHRKDKAR